MSKLNDLITKLCPDGVPYKPMWAITTWDKKFNGVDKKKQPAINKHHYYLAKELEPLIVPNGDIKVLTTSPSDLYTTTELAKDNIKDGEIIAIPWGGNAIVQYYNGKYITSDNRIAIVNDTKQLKCKFLYYVLKNREKELAKYYRGAGIKHPNMFKVLHMEIPLPPLPVQEEVVRILDSFTELEAELEAELADRKEQYEYYRDHLLDKKNLEHMDGKPIEMKKLRDVCSKTKTIKWGDSSDSRFYIDLSSVDMNTHKIGELEQITAENAPSRAKQVVKENDLLFATTRPTQMRCCVIPALLNNQICSTGYCVLRVKDASIDIRYVFRYLTTDKFKAYLGKNQTEGNYPAISDKKLREFQLPVPSLATQERIVDILDRFDALTTSLTDGVPAEIAMRREQYEYYRSRLLDFPRLPDGSASVSDGE